MLRGSITAETAGEPVGEGAAQAGGTAALSGETAVEMAAGPGAALEAARVIAAGGIAAFPTETVYGLGADAFNPAAVARVYAAKGRPGDNPLILHVAGPDAFFELVQSPPDYARALIKAFWPGPLTLVAKKKPGLPAWVGGHPDGMADTVGVRMPSHPLALAVIEASGCVVAAPSANLAGRPSPTLAAHVAEDFKPGEIDFILDGGAVPGGVESTVVDVTGPGPVILRPGAVTAEMIAQAAGLAAHGPGADPGPTDTVAPPRSPGMKYRHYAPRAPMTLLIGSENSVAAYVMEQTAKAMGLRVGVLLTAETEAVLRSLRREGQPGEAPALHQFTLGRKAAPETIAQNLYASLRRFDALGVDMIYAEGLNQSGLGVAIMDRMKKAAEGRVVYVP